MIAFMTRARVIKRLSLFGAVHRSVNSPDLDGHQETPPVWRLRDLQLVRATTRPSAGDLRIEALPIIGNGIARQQKNDEYAPHYVNESERPKEHAVPAKKQHPKEDCVGPEDESITTDPRRGTDRTLPQKVSSYALANEESEKHDLREIRAP
jgi:hypothetical protein